MSVNRIATRYAKSLLQLAIERNSLETIKGDLEQLKIAFKNKDLELMTKSPVIKGSQKMDVFKEVFAGVDNLTMTFLEVLTNKGREVALPEIIKEFFTQYNKKIGILPVKMTTAVPVDNTVLAQAKAKILSSGISATQVEIQNIVNPDILGGFLLEYDGKVYDASVSTRLRKLRKNLRK